MGKIDIAANAYVSENDVFADAFNFLFFNGQEVVAADQLRPLDTSAVLFNDNAAPDDSHKGKRTRDLLKYVTAMSDDSAAYLILGIENQAKVDYSMPVRNMLYDALQYASQVSAISKKHREKKDWGTEPGEFLYGFHKEDRLVPVMTLIIYFSPEAWTGPHSLHEILRIPDNRFTPYIPDYPIHVLAPHDIADERLNVFRSDLGNVLGFIKHSSTKKDLLAWMEKDTARTLRFEAVQLINTCTDAGLKTNTEKEDTIIMCGAIEEIKQDAREEGLEQGLLQSICSLMANLGFSAERAMAALDVPTEDYSRYQDRIAGQALLKNS